MSGMYLTAAGVPVFRAPQPGAAVDAALDWLGRDRDPVAVVTSPSVVRADATQDLLARLGQRAAVVFAGCAPHVPAAVVAELDQRARAAGARTMVSVGGASSVDTAKICVRLRRAQDGRDALAHVATPSTLGGAEFTPFAGMTVDGRKRRVEDPAMIPDAVAHSPAVLADTPRELLLGSVGNAISHCVEGLLSSGADPVSDALHARGLGLLAAYARRPDTRPQALASLQDGAALAAMRPVPMGVVHRLVHVIVPAAPIKHGVAHGVLAPHALTATPTPRPAGVAAIAATLGAPTSDPDPARVAALLRDVLARLGTPATLRLAGVDAAAAERCRAALAGDEQSLRLFERALDGRARPDAAEIHQTRQG